MMNDVKKGIIVLISGPSGVGKKTIQDKLIEEKSLDLNFSISWTTRQPRNGERDGIDYHFITEEEFKQAIKDKRFIEYNNYNGTYYGTPKENIDNILENGHNVLLEIDVNGAKKIMKDYKDSIISFFISPPSKEALEDRLIKRGTEDAYTIQQRLDIASKEMKKSSMYDYTIVNDSLEKAIEEIKIKIVDKRLGKSNEEE